MKTFLLVLIFATNALAIPQLVNYQGQLTSPTGTPLDTTVTILIRLFEVSSGGTAVWSETHPTVSVVDGLFKVELGSVVALPDSVFAASGLWLELKVGADSPLSPRSPLLSVPYALRAGALENSTGNEPIEVQGNIEVQGSGNIGFSNVVAESSFVAGVQDTASGAMSVVSGGQANAALDSFCTIGGGFNNKAGGIQRVCF